jgi:preprotein translocase subunit SecY
MWSTISNITKIPELRKKILFTVTMLLLFRMGTHVTIPGINSLVVSGISSDSSDGFLGMVDLFAGGALLKFSIFALGIMPYISSSIIMQLVMVLIPQLQKLQKEGDFNGRRSISRLTRLITLLWAIVQSIGVTLYLRQILPPPVIMIKVKPLEI